MFLAALALRVCAFLALYRQTMAGTRVYESAIAPVDDLAGDDPQAFLTLYVDEAMGQKPAGLMTAAEKVTLVIEAAIGQAMTVTGQEGETFREIVIPATDPALEWSLDILGHQIARALDTADGWGDLFRRFRNGPLVSAAAIRGVLDGQRIALRQIVLDIAPPAEPDESVLDPDLAVTPWSDFLVALRAIPDDPVLGTDPEMAVYPQLADAIEAAIRAPLGGSWRSVAARLGIAAETAVGLGITPHPLVMPDAEAADFTAVSVAGDRIDSASIAVCGDVPEFPE
jgi:hypothetical protein